MPDIIFSYSDSTKAVKTAAAYLFRTLSIGELHSWTYEELRSIIGT